MHKAASWRLRHTPCACTPMCAHSKYTTTNIQIWFTCSNKFQVDGECTSNKQFGSPYDAAHVAGQDKNSRTWYIHHQTMFPTHCTWTTCHAAPWLAWFWEKSTQDKMVHEGSAIIAQILTSIAYAPLIAYNCAMPNETAAQMYGQTAHLYGKHTTFANGRCYDNVCRGGDLQNGVRMWILQRTPHPQREWMMGTTSHKP